MLLLVVLSSMAKNPNSENMNFRFIIKVFIYAAIAIVLMTVSYIGYLWYTYIDETVISGQAYGFVIGDDKLTTYKKALGALAKLKHHSSSVYIEIKSDADCAKLLAAEPGYTLMVKALLHDVGYPVFKSKNQWDFYFDGSYFNTLSLKFCDEKLCEIYRHRKYFELP